MSWCTAFGSTGGMEAQTLLPLVITPSPGTERGRDGWEFHLTDREVMLLRKPITDVPGGWQSAMREAATRVYPGNIWKVSDDLMRRLYRMCALHGTHGGYQARLPLRVLSGVFDAHREQWTGTYFYGKQEGDDDRQIKFGHTDRPASRNKPFSTDNPRQLRTLFCIWDPTGVYERRVKKHFAQIRRREWYLRTPAVDAFVVQCGQATSTADLPQWPL